MKFSCVYVEEQVRHSDRVEAILAKLPNLPVVKIDRYGEVFNRNAQNFRMQKKRPALILAAKQGRTVLPAPGGYGFDAPASFYFSHMLNCVYDCRYCFLQGMYRSANYVLFTNYDDFSTQIAEVAGESDSVFYSGYDCDSLALEPLSGFTDYFVDWFARQPRLTLEIRTKSTQIRALTQRPALSNCVIAMSFTPESVSRRWESRVPTIDKRAEALGRLQKLGWPVAIRLEPMIWSDSFESDYEALLERLFQSIDADRLHSLSLGMFRMPKIYYDRVLKLYPDEPLYARPIEVRDGLVSQPREREMLMRDRVEALVFRHIARKRYYRCA